MGGWPTHRGFCMIWLFIACTEPLTSHHEDITVESASYSVGWSRLSSSIQEDYGIALSRFEVVLYSMRLPTCSDVAWQWLGFNSAYAGHSEINIPSNWLEPTVLNLLDDGWIEHQVFFLEQSICELAITYARWDGDTKYVVDEAEESFSILLEGVCLENNTPFRLETKVPSEQIVELPELGHSTGSNLDVRLEISLDRVLNPLDCTQLDTWTAKQALEVLSTIQTNNIWSTELTYD